MSNLSDLIKKLWHDNQDSEAKCFRENQECEGAFDYIDRGICNVPLDQIVGSIDILVKIVLTRNLLSSDAEVIGQFVHEKVRQIEGILSTQTWIQGASKIKISVMDSGGV